MALDQYKTQILLLHSQQSTLDNLSTGFSDQYSVHVATSGTEALNIFTETPVHVIVSAQDLPGMSGLDALREAKKRSPDTIGILLAGSDQSDGLEALVGDEEVFQIVRGEITPDALCALIESATKRARLLALSESANDTSANVDHPVAEHIVMETSENGSMIISDGTGQMPALKPQKISVAADLGGRNVDVLVLTKDEDFLSTVKDSTRGLHNVHHVVTPAQAEGIAASHNIGVLVTDAAMVGSKIDVLTHRLRQSAPRLVAVVAGRRDDGELLMDLINRGQVYRFLLKPVSPGRARLAIEASVKYHLEAADNVFKGTPKKAATAPPPRSQAKPAAKPKPKAAVAPEPVSPRAPTPPPMKVSRKDSLLTGGPGEASRKDSGSTGTAAGTAAPARKKAAAAPGTRLPDIDIPAPDRLSVDIDDSSGGLMSQPKTLGMAAAGLAAVAALGWFILSGDDAPPAADAGDNPSTQPAVVETEIALPPASQSTVAAPEPAIDFLARARAARDSGSLVAPPGENAVELYLSAIEAAPGNAAVAAEIDAVIEQVVGLAESAILEQRLDDAAVALQLVQLATPDNSRLPFLTAQIDQLRLRSTIDDARLAIREGRFEDASSLIGQAAEISPADSSEVTLLSGELVAARSAQRIDEVLALANSRLEQNSLISPSNDNARYYYELALSIDPGNTAARQGLSIVATKLALQARAAIEDGQLTNAEDLLRTARALDPSSAELAASATALDAAKAAEARAQAAAAAEAERIAEAERLAEEQRATAAAAQAASAALPVADAQQANNGSAALSNTGSGGVDTPNDSGSNDVLGAGTAPATVTLNSGSANTGAATADNGSIVNPAGRAAPETVPISRLTRVNYVAPKYPRSAQRRNVTGSVDVAFTVQQNGTVTAIEVLASNPGSTFTQAAMDAVAQWRFEPTIENGSPVEKRTAVRLAFNLQ